MFVRKSFQHPRSLWILLLCWSHLILEISFFPCDCLATFARPGFRHVSHESKFKQADRSGDCQCPNATLCAEVAQKAQNVAPAMFEVAIENPLVVHDTYVIEVSFIFIYIHTLMQYICRSRKHVPRGIHFIQNDCLGPGGAYLHSVFPVPPNCSYTLGTL
jgi:hypothetical protein